MNMNVNLAFLGAIGTSSRIIDVSILIEPVVAKDAVVVQEFDLSVFFENT